MAKTVIKGRLNAIFAAMLLVAPLSSVAAENSIPVGTVDEVEVVENELNYHGRPGGYQPGGSGSGQGGEHTGNTGGSTGTTTGGAGISQENPFATGGQIVSETAQSTLNEVHSSNEILNDLDGMIDPNVTFESVFDMLTRKGYQAADGVRQVCIPITVIFFVVGAILLIWGAVSKRATIIPGVLTMLFSVIGFTLIVYAPQIMAFFSRWFVQ